MSEVEITALLVSGVVGLLVPWLTELITRSATRVELKSAVTAALSALDGVVVTVVVVPGPDWKAYLLAIGAAWVASMRAYFTGIVRPIAPNSGIIAPKPLAPPSSDRRVGQG